MNSESEEELEDNSRRSFMKKGVLASSAAALGFAGSGSVSGEISDGNQRLLQQQPGTGLVFVDDYNPGVQFTVVSRVQQTTVNQILGQTVDDNQVVQDPTDYNGYIVTYSQNCAPGSYNLVFVRQTSLEEGQTYSFSRDATFFNNQIQLLESTIQTGGGGGGGGNQTAGGRP
jgi:hypothetical protein